MNTRFIECGSCGEFHKDTYYGDCRNDEERFTYEQINAIAMEETGDYADIVWLEFQED